MNTTQNKELPVDVKIAMTDLVQILDTPLRRDFASSYLRGIVDADGYMMSEDTPTERVENLLVVRLIVWGIWEVIEKILLPIEMQLPLSSDMPDVAEQAEKTAQKVEDLLKESLRTVFPATGTPERATKGLEAIAWFKDGKIRPPGKDPHFTDWMLWDYERPLQIFAETIGRVQTLARDAFPDPTEPDTTQSMLP